MLECNRNGARQSEQSTECSFSDEGEAQMQEMSTHGQISEFHGNAKEWTSYVECLECYFVENDVIIPEKQFVSS